MIRIGNRELGPGHPTCVVAELSCNHHQSYRCAQQLVREAQWAGADCVKVQAYDAGSMVWPGTTTTWHGQRLHDLYEGAGTPWEWHRPLQQLAQDLGMQYFASVFDRRGVEFMHDLGVPCFKVAAFEIVDLDLIAACAKTGKPVILSTGMATEQEIDDAVGALWDATNEVMTEAPPFCLLKCTSAYPADPKDAHLRTIPAMWDQWDGLVGLSDHTLGATVPVAAVALGACMVEKHLTMERAAGGLDASFSLEPQEFRAMVEAIRATEQILGEVRYGPAAAELESLGLRRSLWVVQDIQAGEQFTREHVRSLRPAGGLGPRYLYDVLGRRATGDVAAGTPLILGMVEEQGA